MSMDNFEFKKSLGQNFIIDDNIIDKIVKYSDIDKDTLVVEIGPGAGSLSRKIIPLSGYSILYEIDNRLKGILNDVLRDNENYEIIFDDFLNQDIRFLRDNYNYKKIYVVANLPYYITTPIITKLLDELYPDKIIVMVQEEVADRLSANCGNREYGMISVLLGSRYNIKKLFKVSRNSFKPIPNVDSAVICMEKNDKLMDTNKDKFNKLLRDAFQFKRKNLRNNLKGYDLNMVSAILNKYSFDLTNRAEDITIDVFVEIARNL